MPSIPDSSGRPRLPIPKPVRPPKVRKQLRRKTPLKRSAKPIRRSPIEEVVDPANFREEDLIAVYGSIPRCIVTGTGFWLDRHHVIGRGKRFGFGYKHYRRKMFSSVLNCAIIARWIHDDPRIDSLETRLILLGEVEKLVTAAVADGKYVLSEIDQDFLGFVKAWKRNNLA